MVTKEEKIAKIEEFLKELEDLIILSHREGQEQFYNILARLKSFLKLIFTDGQTRYNDCVGFSISSGYETEEEKQRDYLDEIKRVKRYLIAYKEELQFQDEIVHTSTKLNSIEKDIKEKQLESKRRQSVAETKFYGASIEMIDLLRKELKDRSKTNEDIIEIKKDIKEIKEILKNLPKN